MSTLASSTSDFSTATRYAQQPGFEESRIMVEKEIEEKEEVEDEKENRLLENESF